jgi:multiple sugar transport system permease protein
MRQREAIWGVALSSPIIIGFLLWYAGPIVASLLISFTDWNVLRPPTWVGLDNFVRIFTADRLFWQSLTVTVVFAAASVPLLLAIAFALALLLSERVRGIALFRTAIFLPSIVPLIAASVIWDWLFVPEAYGLLNAALRALGIPALPWLLSTQTALMSLILMNLWTVGGLMLIFLAGLQGVPRELYEAAEIDGANALHRLRHVTIPMMTPTIFFNLILAVVASMQTFVQPYLMTEGGPANSTLVLVLYLYRKAFAEFQLGYASALATILFVVIAILTVVIFRSSQRWVHYEGSR